MLNLSAVASAGVIFGDDGDGLPPSHGDEASTSERADHDDDLGRDIPTNDSDGEEALTTGDVEEALKTGDVLKLRGIAKRIYGLAWKRSEEEKAAFRLGDMESARASAVLSHEAWVMIKPVVDHMRRNQGHMDDHVLATVENMGWVRDMQPWMQILKRLLIAGMRNHN